MTYSRPITEIISQRFSFRTYSRQPIPEEKRWLLGETVDALRVGPLGSALRFCLVASAEGDSAALKGLGTYGFIRNPGGFLIGAAVPGEKYLEDFGCAMESLVLSATDLGLGTCWLGGSFRRGSFSHRIELTKVERIPAVASVGVIEDAAAARSGAIRRLAGGERRLPWESLFHDGGFGVPLSREAAGPFATALENVRVAPSGSNKQPWRVMREGRNWHFFLRRTSGYNGLGGKLFKVEDLQRVDIGIAMCHFQLTVEELGLGAGWAVQPPRVRLPDRLTEYVVSWEG